MNSWRSAGVRAAQWVARLRRESSAKSKSSFATVRIARRRSTVFALVFKSGSVQDLQHRIDRFMNVIGGGSRRGGSDRPQHEHPGQRDPNESRHDPHAPSPRPVALWDLGRRAIVASPRRDVALSPAPPRVQPPSPHVEQRWPRARALPCQQRRARSVSSTCRGLVLSLWGARAPPPPPDTQVLRSP